MIWSILAQLFDLCIDVVTVFTRSERQQAVEVILLRQQLRILERKQQRPARISRWEKLTLAILSARLKGRGRLHGLCQESGHEEKKATKGGVGNRTGD